MAHKLRSRARQGKGRSESQGGQNASPIGRIPPAAGNARLGTASRLRLAPPGRPAYVYASGIYQEAGMARSSVFKNNRSQAIRLPKAVAFPEDVREVEIVKVGQSRIITPVGRRWDDFFQNGPRVSDDFMTEREDPMPQEREPL
jgi:antitoxin VapB